MIAVHSSARYAFGLLAFNAISALGGGIALMTGVIPEQASWIRETDFDSLYLPGLVLFAVVGGSSAVAAVALLKGVVGWELASILAGVVMVVWVVGEIASIRGFHVLQVLYLATGIAVLWCTGPADERTSASRRRPEERR